MAGFKKDDFILIHSSKGFFEVNKIKNIPPVGDWDLYLPLLHSFNKDQVYRIPQYSTVRINKDVDLSLKKWDGMTGGVIAFFCNEGLIIEGTISSQSGTKDEVIPDQRVKKSDSAVIAVLASYKSKYLKKVVDLKTTNSFLTVTIPIANKLSFPKMGITLINHNYQHITIPPNLDLHLSKKETNAEKLWYSKPRNLISPEGYLKKDYQKLITVIFPPISSMPAFTSRKYSAALIIGLSELPHWSDNTGFVLELFAQKAEDTKIPLDKHYEGELGSLMPFKYSDMAKTFPQPYKQGNFFIRPFVITNHDKKSPDELSIFFG